MKNLYKTSLFLLLFLMLFFSYSFSSLEDITLTHTKMYRAGSVVDINELLNLGGRSGTTLDKVILGYNMIRSDLEVEWLFNDEVLGRVPLERGMGRKTECLFQRVLPGRVQIRFAGPAGMVQVTSLSATFSEPKLSTYQKPILGPRAGQTYLDVDLPGKSVYQAVRPPSFAKTINQNWLHDQNKTEMAGKIISLSWEYMPGAGRYRIQISGDRNFSGRVVDQIVSGPSWESSPGLARGSYYWRIRAEYTNGSQSAWSSPQEVTFIPLAGLEELFVETEILNVPLVRQRKDTSLLCLGWGRKDGCPRQGQYAWDVPQPDSNGHGSHYCVRASLVMVNGYYGGTLTQDRLTYHIQQESWSPFGNKPRSFSVDNDLRHRQPCGAIWEAGNKFYTGSLGWALNIREEYEFREKSKGDFVFTVYKKKPEFDLIRTWIKEGRPLIRETGGHCTVISGFAIGLNGKLWVRLNDPANSSPKWVVYDQNFDTGRLTVCPRKKDVKSAVRDEIDVRRDSDHDGITDFDETKRFHTNPLSADSDNDGLSDKEEIASYLFDAQGNFIVDFNPDPDGDGIRNELDPDSNNNGIRDGQESQVWATSPKPSSRSFHRGS